MYVKKRWLPCGPRWSLPCDAESTPQQEIDEAKVEAKYSDGVLKLTRPLPEKTKARQIEIA